MKRCPNNHDNPDNAKFCRICGYNFDDSFSSKLKNYWNTFVSFATRIFNTIIKERKTRLTSMGHSSGFTPDMFPSINLTPCSVAKVDFQCKKGVVFMAVLIVLFVALSFFEYQIRNTLAGLYAPSFVYYNTVPIILGIFLVLFLFKFIPFICRLWKWFNYKTNANYIEHSAFMNNLYRIAKKGRLGLFDKNKNMVTMGSHYDNISKFDSEHILMEKDGKKGLFSLKKMGLIVPIRFDRIDAFKNSIVKCHKGAESYYYDVNGNRME